MDDLAIQHDKLIGEILIQEEALISGHRESLRRWTIMINEEMKHIDRIDQPGSDVDAYVAFMDENLNEKEKMVRDLRLKLDRFKSQLDREEKLSRLFQDKTNRQG